MYKMLAVLFVEIQLSAFSGEAVLYTGILGCGTQGTQCPQSLTVLGVRTMSE